MQRIISFVLLSYALFISQMLNGCSNTDTNRPNIIFILADDLGYSDIGAFGSEIQTPHLDLLAENGIRFTQMHNTGKCFPTRAALLTGLYAQQVDMHGDPGDFHNAVMFGEVLGEAGYHTLYVGKHHGTDNPYDWGFDHYRGLRDGAANYFNPGEQRPSDPGPPAQKENHYPRTFAFDDSLAAPYTPPEDYYGTDTWTDWALELLEISSEEEDPFLLYLSYQAPHDPLQAPEESIEKYEGIYEVGYDEIAEARYNRQRQMDLLDDRYPRSEPTYRDWESLSDSARTDQVRRMQVYAAMIDRMDENIGRVIRYLEQQSELDNTLVMFASDNGASAEEVEIGEGPIGSMTRWTSLKSDWANVSNTPFRMFKNYSHQGGIATPFIVHWPAGIPDGGRVDHSLIHFIDIMPTLIGLSEAEYPGEYKGEAVPPTEGVSLLPLFRGESIERDNPLFYDWRNGSAIQNEDWKLVRWKDEWELFDMTTDRTETNDLSQEHRRQAEELKDRWREWASQYNIIE